MRITVNELKTPIDLPGRRFWHEVWVGEDKIVKKLETELFPYKGEDIYVIYKLQILHKFRRKGYGSEIIKYCEDLATKKGLKKLLCRIEPFDRTVSFDNLKSFYKQNGFNFEKEGSTTFAIKEIGI